MLYARTIFAMLISLFTSRVTLEVLGVNNYGISSAVGGVVAMFSVVSGSLSASISRFVTFELGRGDMAKLKRIFSTAINVQLMMGAIILLLGETVGVWFLNTQMNIPQERLVAANWVLQCAILSFFTGLTQIPYTACIIGHEKMSVFAWFSILESIFRLVIVYMLYMSPFDKLITLSVLGLVVSIGLRMAKRIYCTRHFEECHYTLTFDRSLLKEMTSFASWSFFTHANYLLNNQGINILINIFFGVGMNAARGVAVHAEHAVMKFITSFTTAVNPQITKSYAAGQLQPMYALVCRAARFSYFIMFLFSLPLIFEAETVLNIWLTVVPEKAKILFQLSLVLGMEDAIGKSSFTALMATGKIKKYATVVFFIGILEFPLTWIAFFYGAPVESAYYLYILVKGLVLVARLYLMESLLGLPKKMYLNEVWWPVTKTTIVALLPMVAIAYFLPVSFARFLISVPVAMGMVAVTALYLGMTQSERETILNKAYTMVRKYVGK